MNCFSNISKKFLPGKTNMVHKPILLLLILLISVFSLFSEELGDFYLEERLLTWGVDVDFCYRLTNGFLEGKDTIFTLTIGGAANWMGYYRDENDIYTEDSDLDYTFTRANANWGLGIEQGLLWNDKTNKNLLSILLKYRAMRAWNFNMANQNSILFDSIRPDKDGVLYNTFIVALILDDTLFYKDTGLRKGLHTEVAAEIGPKWFFNDNIGIADFTKLFINVKYFHPLYETKRTDKSIKAIYLVDSVGVDYVFGNDIPLPVRQTYGVLRPADGCGGRVRGFENRRFDSEIKIINNFDIRFIMPQIKNGKGSKILRPGVLAFFDTCYFDKLEGYKEDGSGVLMSTGFTLFSELLFLGNCLFTVGFPIIGERIDKGRVAIKLDYGMRF
ncbi:MAG: hypothetical protein FWE72_02385 [Spirochaetaceae bacterium]|nr:hypothetical protein [Spirochaetaceae bacterium]